MTNRVINRVIIFEDVMLTVALEEEEVGSGVPIVHHRWKASLAYAGETFHSALDRAPETPVKYELTRLLTRLVEGFVDGIVRASEEEE